MKKSDIENLDRNKSLFLTDGTGTFEVLPVWNVGPTFLSGGYVCRNFSGTVQCRVGMGLFRYEDYDLEKDLLQPVANSLQDVPKKLVPPVKTRKFHGIWYYNTVHGGFHQSPITSIVFEFQVFLDGNACGMESESYFMRYCGKKD